VRHCTKRELTEEEFKKFLAEHDQAPLRFDGMRYTFLVPMGQGGRRTTVWNKPVACVMGKDPDKKFFVIEDK
jgi:hypothetical protein